MDLGPFNSLLQYTGQSTESLGNNNANVQRTPAPASTGFSFGNLAKSAGKAVVGAGEGIAHAITSAPEAVAHGISSDVIGHQQLRDINTQRSQLDQAQQHLFAIRNTLSKDQYTSALKNLTQGYQNLSDQAKQNASQYESPGKFVAGEIGSAALAVPFGGAVDTAAEGAAGTSAKIAANLGAKVARPGVEGAVSPTVESVGKQVVGGAVRNAVITQPTVNASVGAVQNAATGHVKQALEQAGIFLGVPAVGKYVPAAVGAAKDAVFGKSGVLDNVFGPRVVQFLQDHPEFNDTAKQMQQFTLNHVGGSNADAAEHLSNYLKSELKINPQSDDLQHEFERAQNFFKERGRLQSHLDANPKVQQNLVLSHAVKSNIGKVSYGIQQAAKEGVDLTDGQARARVASEVVDRLNLNDVTLEDRLKNAIFNGESVKEINSNLKGVQSKAEIKLPGFRAGKGFSVVRGPKSITRLPTAEQSGDLRFGTEAKLPRLGNALSKAGFSPNAVSGKAVTSQVRQNFADNLKNTPNLPETSNDILKRLNAAASGQGKLSAVDPRLLFKGEIDKVLGAHYTPGQIKAVRQAVFDSYAKLKPEQVGIGNYIVNQALAHSGGLMGDYLRVQGILRYNLNPFFSARVLAKSSIIAGLHGSLPVGRVSDETMQALQDGGFFSKGATDQGTSDFLGQSSIQKDLSSIGKVQRQIVGRLAETMAATQGKTAAEALSSTGPLHDEIVNAIQTTIGYPKDGYISSPLAKSLNVLVFPSRFDTKVIGAAAKAMAQMPPIGQAILVQDLAHGYKQLSSPEGQQWQKDNSELVQVMKYFTPIGTVQNLLDGINGGVKLADLGEIGGLPFGVIQQGLSAQGVTVPGTGSSPYVDPKTGKIIADSIPDDTKGRFQQGALSLLNSMFSWPGAQLGLPTKSGITKAIVGIKGGNKDFKANPLNGTTPGVQPGGSLPALGQATGVGAPGGNEVVPQSFRFANDEVGHSTTSSSRAKKSKVVPTAARVQH